MIARNGSGLGSADLEVREACRAEPERIEGSDQAILVGNWSVADARLTATGEVGRLMGSDAPEPAKEAIRNGGLGPKS